MVPAALIVALVAVILYVARSVRTYLSLRQFGGHWSAGWSRIWLLKTQSSGEMNKRFTAITNKYGESILYQTVGFLPLSDNPPTRPQPSYRLAIPYNVCRPSYFYHLITRCHEDAPSILVAIPLGTPSMHRLTDACQAPLPESGHPCSSHVTRSCFVA
jgi:hypothetical protein